MANGQGGARKGAGRKPKPLAEKIAAGNPSHRPLKKLGMKGGGSARIKAPEYLKITIKPSNAFPSAVEFFDEIVAWLETTGCLHMIPAGNIANYALAKFFLVEAAYTLAKTATVGRDGSDNYVVTGFAKAFFECGKTANAMWDVIWQVVRDNSETLIKNPEDDFIAMISSQRLRRRTRGAKNDGFNGHTENSGFTAESGEV